MADVEIGDSQLCDQMSGRDQLERPRASLTERYEWQRDEREPDRGNNYRARSQRTNTAVGTKDEEPDAAQAVPWIEARGAMGSYGVPMEAFGGPNYVLCTCSTT